MRDPPIDRIYRTKAYDILEAYCDDDQGGCSDNALMCDKWDRQQVINLLIPIIRKEERDRKQIDLGDKK